MPPQIKCTREEILAAAMELTRERGFDAVTARDVGARLGTTAKPVYRAFPGGMGELKQAVLEQIWELFLDYRQQELGKNAYPPYKAVGMAYIRFAAEEPELFRLLFMRNRSGEQWSAADGDYGKVVQIVQHQTGLENAQADRFHAEMWVCVHGIATMLATSYFYWDFDQISQMLTDLYQGLRSCYETDKSDKQEGRNGEYH